MTEQDYIASEFELAPDEYDPEPELIREEIWYEWKPDINIGYMPPDDQENDS